MSRTAVAVGVLVAATLACAKERGAQSEARLSDTSSSVAGGAGVNGQQTESPRRLLEAGDTFDLRRVGGIALDSSAIRALACTQRPPISEKLIINDEADYSVVRIVDRDCGGSVQDTLAFGSTYKLTADTAQFYLSDGNEARTGMRGRVTADSLIGLDGDLGTRPGYSRRKH